MAQTLTLTLDEATANGLIAVLETAMRVDAYKSGRIAVPIINELLRQDAEFKKANPVTTQPAITNAGGEPTQP
jgi:hypothetical protein